MATTPMTTRHLEPGMRVQIGRRVVRTVGSVQPTSLVTNNGEPIMNVYFDAPEPDDWGRGNSATQSATWNVIE
jgi:hypothetical protein